MQRFALLSLTALTVAVTPAGATGKDSRASAFRPGIAVENVYRQQIDDVYFTDWFARLEGAKVLLREHGRRTEQGDLAAFDGHAERSAERDLGLAEADVAANEAIHRAR